MSSEFHKRLYDVEISPPSEVWDRLSVELDEINADNLIANRIQNTLAIPPPFNWEKITGIAEFEESHITKKKAVLVNWKRFAVAAIFFGLVISVWLIFFNTQKSNESIVISNNPSTNIQENKSLPENPVTNKTSDQSENKTKSETPLLASNKKNTINKSNKNNGEISKHLTVPLQNTNLNSVVLKKEIAGDKVFNQPIDDLTMIAASDNYMTMVNANGRIVKIPSHLAHLAPHLQDKPITKDYYELMFGEGAYWKEKMSDWQQKLATSPVSSGDLFSNMVELLKSVEAGQANPPGQGR